MTWVKCHNPKCLREWDYKGDKKFYAACPDCKHSAKIPEHEETEEKPVKKKRRSKK